MVTITVQCGDDITKHKFDDDAPYHLFLQHCKGEVISIDDDIEPDYEWLNDVNSGR